MSAPLLVVPNKGEATNSARVLTRQGWKIQQGSQLPERPWDISLRRLVVTTMVVDRPAIKDTVLAATRGAGVIAVTADVQSLTSALIGDLGQIGTVFYSAAELADTHEICLPVEQRALLSRLARGASIAAAAEAEFLSLRTANRRLARARDVLGVRTTREAVVEYVRANNGV